MTERGERISRRALAADIDRNACCTTSRQDIQHRPHTRTALRGGRTRVLPPPVSCWLLLPPTSHGFAEHKAPLPHSPVTAALKVWQRQRAEGTSPEFVARIASQIIEQVSNGVCSLTIPPHRKGYAKQPSQASCRATSDTWATQVRGCQTTCVDPRREGQRRPKRALGVARSTLWPVADSFCVCFVFLGGSSNWFFPKTVGTRAARSDSGLEGVQNGRPESVARTAAHGSRFDPCWSLLGHFSPVLQVSICE